MSYNFYQCYPRAPCNDPCAKTTCKKKSKCRKYVPECKPYIPPCPPVNPCPIVSYSTTSPTATVVPSGTSTTIGPVTPIISFSTAPIINGGLGSTSVNNICVNGYITTGITNITNTGVITNQVVTNNFAPVISTNNTITLNTTNGQFTVPIAGRYLITAFIGFVETGTSNGVGTRQLYIYKVDGTTSTVTLLAEDSRNAVTTGNTYSSISTVGDLNANDRIYFAVSQNSLITLSTTTDGRFTFNRLC